MKNKKICKLLCPTAGILSFMISTGVCSMPAYAGETTSVTSEVAANNTDALTVNKSVEINGVKITVLDVIAIKNEIKTRIKFEKKNGICEEVFSNAFVRQTYGNDDDWGGGSTYTPQTDNSIIYEVDNQLDDGEYAEKGTLRIDVVIPKLDVNGCIKVPVDFTDQFKNIKSIEVNRTIDELNNIKITKIESNLFGTDLHYKVKNSEDDYVSDYNDNTFLIKNNDKYYKVCETGSNIGEDDYETGYYRCEALKYDRINTNDAISIIPIKFSLDRTEFHKIYRSSDEDNEDMATKDNIKYTKTFKFNDNSKGEIYKIEKEENKLKIYCKAETEDNSIIMTNNLNVNYLYDEESEDEYMYYDQDQNACMYKDPSEENGYVYECSNIDNSKKIVVSVDNKCAYNSKYTVGKEIKLN